MTSFQSASQALGMMSINYFNQIANVLPDLMINTDGPKRMYPLVKGLDAMLVSYRTMMFFEVYDEERKKAVHYNYWETAVKLEKTRKLLRMNNMNDLDKWTDYFHDYLVLLASCFNAIGLGPDLNIKDSNVLDVYEQSVVPEEFREQYERDNQGLPGEGVEPDPPREP